MRSYVILGLIDSFRPTGEMTLGYKVIGSESDLPYLIQQYPNVEFFIAIGDNWTRSEMYLRMLKIVGNIRYAKAIHPNAQIGRDVEVGDGTAIMAGCVVNTSCTIGRFVILNTNSSVDHDSTVADFASFAPNSCAGGNVSIGSHTAISIGANIIHDVQIGQNSLVGAGALVMRDFGDNIVLYGVPAIEIRQRENNERYF
jgi:sugar O-acyltransferase (sialic acid O-acetyltransferase NeuD family)